MSVLERGAKRAQLNQRETAETRARNLLRTQLPSMRSRDQALDELCVTYTNGPPRIAQIAAALWILGERGQFVNLNDHVRVRLTDHGREILHRESEWPLFFKLQHDGSYIVQFWQLMVTFGPHMYHGGESPMEMEIEWLAETA